MRVFFRFYFLLWRIQAFLDFEVDFSGTKWFGMDESGPALSAPPLNAISKAGSVLRLRGNTPATMDEKGRLKLPSSFKAELEAFAKGEGGGVARHYLTSLDGRSARLYPMPVWEAIEARLATLPSTNPAKRKFLETTAYFGSEVEPDAQGRFVVPPILREAALLTGEVAVLGQMDHLAIWNRAGFERRLAAEPLGADDLAQLADLGI